MITIYYSLIFFKSISFLGFKDSYKKDQAKDSQRDEVMKESFFKDSVQPATSTERSASKMVVTSGINKGRENLLVGGGHSARGDWSYFIII